MASVPRGTCPGGQSPQASMGGSWGISVPFLWVARCHSKGALSLPHSWVNWTDLWLTYLVWGQGMGRSIRAGSLAELGLPSPLPLLGLFHRPPGP